MPEDRLLSKEEVAQRLGVKEKTFSKYVREGLIVAVINPRNGSIVGVKESELQNYFNGGAVVGDGQEVSDTNHNPEEEKLDGEIRVARKQRELALLNADIKDIEEFRAKVEDVNKRGQEVAEGEKSLAETKQSFKQDEAEKKRELDNREHDIIIMEEQSKKELIDARERISRVDEEHKKNREAQDKKRQASHAVIISNLDMAYDALYNAPKQAISNRLLSTTLGFLEICMDGFGMTREYNDTGYVMNDLREEWVGVDGHATEKKKIGRSQRLREYAPTDDELPKNAKTAYKLCMNVFKYNRDYSDGIGTKYCEKSQRTMKQLRAIMKGKTDEELAASMDAIRSRFGYLDGVMMGTVEEYQKNQRNGFSEAADWMCRVCDKIESLLDIGVVD